MKKLFLTGVFLLPAFASAQVTNQFGLGLGSQYGGLAGLKYTLGTESNRFSVGAGVRDSHRDRDDLYGIAFGWEKLLGQHHTLGAFVRTKRDQDVNLIVDMEQGPNGPVYTTVPDDLYQHFIGASYTYYFRPASESGFLGGINLGKTYQYSDSRRNWQDGVDVSIQLGYQF